MIGPPASGKETWADENTRPGEILINFDRLATSLGARDTDSLTSTERKAATAARQGIIRGLEEGYISGSVTALYSFPSPATLDRLRELGAEFITIDPGKEETLSRATSEKRPPETIDAIHRWYNNPPQVKDSDLTQETTTAEDDAPGYVAASTSERTMEGIVLPWGAVGTTSKGQLIFERGNLDVPSDLQKVKLLAGHSPDGHPVGHAVAAEEREEGLWMKFQLGNSEHATSSLMQAADHVVDAFSIEARGVKSRGRYATEGLLKAVALVPFPAFDAARVTTVNAEDAPKEEENKVANSEDQETDGTNDNNKEIHVPESVKPRFSEANKTNIKSADFARATDILLAAHRGEMSLDDVHAELTDITGASSITTTAPAWLGELWSGVQYERRVVPLIQNAALRSRKIKGFKWKTKPGVGKWSANKTDIPSKRAEWEEVEATSQPWAGGNDLDRQIFDFNETDTIQAYWRAMAESYAYETDKATAEWLTSVATDIEDSTTDLLRAVTRGGIRVDQAIHSPASFVLVNPLDLETVLDFSQLDVPHYTGLTPVSTPDKWTTSEFVQQGTAIVGSKMAATFYELAGSPLRVEAEHIAKGGRDAALFGYTGHLLNREGGLVKVHFTKPSAPAHSEM
ncbi:hypothetical protein QP918_03410 [Corynebacterium accolens]|uniref:hypothetical protein n=1 Tax=Corynebacterium accolens TaxID=38284 RepID=UPI0025514857|nr:hypothetical protein [Corynebacterium accolens]MDK8674502.1 hypothetical protein [Corynebacterium accolens]